MTEPYAGTDAERALALEMAGGRAVECLLDLNSGYSVMYGAITYDSGDVVVSCVSEGDSEARWIVIGPESRARLRALLDLADKIAPA